MAGQHRQVVLSAADLALATIEAYRVEYMNPPVELTPKRTGEGSRVVRLNQKICL